MKSVFYKNFNRSLTIGGLLCVVLTLFGVQISAPLRDERRTFAPYPHPTLKEVLNAQYFSQLEKFVDDRFFFRNWMIYAKTSLDQVVFNKNRKDLIIGKNNFIFYKNSARLNFEESIRNFPYDRWEKFFNKISTIASRQGKKVMFIGFRGKDYIYRDYLPKYWRGVDDYRQLPLFQLNQVAQKYGISVTDYSELFLALRSQGLQIFTPYEDTHPSPEAYYQVLKLFLGDLGTRGSRKIILPDDFPKKRVQATNLKSYLDYFPFLPDYPNPVDWTQVLDRRPKKVWDENLVYIYEGSNKAPISRTISYGDSFFDVLQLNFKDALLPHFQSYGYHFGDCQLDGWKEAKTVIFSLSDQSAVGYLPCFERVADLAELAEKK